MTIKRFIAQFRISLRNRNDNKLEKKEKQLAMRRNKALKEAVRIETLADKLAKEHEAQVKLNESWDKLRAEKAKLSGSNPQWGNMGASLAKGLKKFGSELKTGNAAISKWAKASREKNMPQYFDK
jgi:hypothetical protein